MRISLNKKIILVVLMIAVVLAGAAMAVSYQIYSRTMDDHYATLSTNVASSAAALVNGEDVARMTRETLSIYRSFCPDEATPPDFDAFTDAQWDAYYAAFAPVRQDPAYDAVFRTLNRLKEENDVLWMYIVLMDAQTNTGLYIIDADKTEDACPTGTPAEILPANAALMAQGVYDFPPYVTNYEEFGWLSSASMAIRDESGNVIANANVDISMNEVMADRQSFLIRLVTVLAVASLMLIALLTFLVRRTIVRPINKLSNAAADFITNKQKGNKDTSAISQLHIKTGDEIEKLSDAFQNMEQEINTYISDLTQVTAERERIGAELDVAKSIQASMLPCIFPPFPQREEFDIYATMTPAKEVGGDFYDFFLVDDDHLALVIADVSGKGVPAAMFMVIAKTLLKNSAQAGLSPRAVLEKVNNQLCENNDAEMFVTVWLGILEISTGRMVCANAGHEFPAIRRRDGAFELFRDKHGFVLAGMEDVKYREYELRLEDGDTLFVYTDGVPEATDASNTLFGTERMLAALNRGVDQPCETLLACVKQDIDAFVGAAPQFDDITMLALTMRANRKHMHKKNILPELSSLGEATAFFEEALEANHAPARVVAQVNVAVDEIFSNIARYSGATAATLGCMAEEGRITLRFSDNGRPYDPTQQADPDVSADLEDREIGGLGIFMVKKTMDNLHYEYADGLNILTMEKGW